MAQIELSADFATDYIKRIIGKDYYQLDFVGWNPGADPGTPTLRLKTLASVTGLLSRASSYPASGFASSPGNLTVQCALMSGTVPTSINDLTSYSAISPNILVRFGNNIVRNSNGMQDFTVATVDSTNPAVINSEYVMADVSGTATWFLLFGLQHFASNYTDNIVPFIMGTVGTTASGADLQIPDTNVIAEQAYRIVDLRLQFPTSWVV